jgi:hypothetical protein
LGQVQKELQAMGVTLALADINDQLRQLLDRYRLTEQIAPANVFNTIRGAVSAYRRGPGTDPGPESTGRSQVTGE